MNAKEFLKSKGDDESPYGEVIWNFDTALNEWLSDLLEEYAKLKILNIQNVTDMLPKFSDMENKVLDAKAHQKEEHLQFVKGYELGYRHCYNWIKRIVSLLGNEH